MKIRKKSTKPSRSKPPLYIVGFSASPSPAELQPWFDLEYGGPLSLKTTGSEHDHGGSTIVAAHGPWAATIQWSVPSEHAETWQHRLDWQHAACATVSAVPATRSNMIDTVLHAARIARGLTLLTDGTAYDITTQAYLNPSDWIDRPLTSFQVQDHITVVQADDPEQQRDWFYTRGMSTFGLDDIEVFQPIGLPSNSTLDTMYRIADEVIHQGHSPKVGSSLTLPHVALVIRILRHRTHLSADVPFVLREVSW